MDDLCSMLIHRKHDFAAAEKYARSNYQSLTDKKLGMVWYGMVWLGIDTVLTDRQKDSETNSC